MAKVYLLTGRIASGKTAWAERLAGKHNAVLLSCDELMLSLFDECLGPRHAETELRCLQYLCGIAADTALCGTDAVLDSGLSTGSARAAARGYLAQRGVETVTVYFRLPEALRAQRLEERNARLANSPKREYIIDKALCARLDAEYEEPGEGEYDLMIGE